LLSLIANDIIDHARLSLSYLKEGNEEEFHAGMKELVRTLGYPYTGDVRGNKLQLLSMLINHFLPLPLFCFS
jgi:hypothetical protein